MSDRDLLELAAKAAGIQVFPGRFGSKHALLIDAGLNGYVPWNPLTDDGDALRLAVKAHVEFYEGDDDGPTAYAGYFLRGETRQRFSIERFGDDPYAATRRAIVRAAAEIGKTLTGEN